MNGAGEGNPRHDPIRSELVGGDKLGRALVTGVPAFVRRAKAMEDALENLFVKLRAEWEARLRIAFPGGVAGDRPDRVRSFNSRWKRYLERVGIAHVQELQAKYNRYFPIERELALPGAPRMKFEEVRILQREELFARFPPLDPGGPQRWEERPTLG